MVALVHDGVVRWLRRGRRLPVTFPYLILAGWASFEPTGKVWGERTRLLPFLHPWRPCAMVAEVE